MVLALILAAREDDEFRMLVLAVASVAPSEVEAFVIFVLAVFTFVLTAARVEPSDDEATFVFALTAAVPAVIAEARLDEAARTLAFVVPSLVPRAANVAPSELEAFVTSDCMAREPEDSDAPVRSRVP